MVQNCYTRSHPVLYLAPSAVGKAWNVDLVTDSFKQAEISVQRGDCPGGVYLRAPGLTGQGVVGVLTIDVTRLAHVTPVCT